MLLFCLYVFLAWPKMLLFCLYGFLAKTKCVVVPLAWHPNYKQNKVKAWTALLFNYWCEVPRAKVDELRSVGTTERRTIGFSVPRSRPSRLVIISEWVLFNEFWDFLTFHSVATTTTLPAIVYVNNHAHGLSPDQCKGWKRLYIIMMMRYIIIDITAAYRGTNVGVLCLFKSHKASHQLVTLICSV